MTKTKCERIMDALNTMKPIRNKKVRREFAEIYGQIYSICEGEILSMTEGKCPECGSPATHPSGLCRDCHQGKLEAEDP